MITIYWVVEACFQKPLCKFNTEDLESLLSQLQPTFTQSLAAAISSILDISCNPALCSLQALEIFIAKISSIVTAWAAEQYKAVPKTGSSTPMSLRASPAAEIVVALYILLDIEIQESIQADNSKQDILEFINYLQRTAKEPYSDTHLDEITLASMSKNQRAIQQTTLLLLDNGEIYIQQGRYC